MITWVDRLISEYTQGKQQLEAYQDTLDPDVAIDAEEAAKVRWMISNLQFGINHMHTGRPPGAVRGIDRRAAYQRSIILDTELFPSLIEDIKPESRLTNEEKKKLADVLWRMSVRERTCFVLNVAYGLSYADIAKELKLSKSSVQKFIERARVKAQ